MMEFYTILYRYSIELIDIVLQRWMGITITNAHFGMYRYIALFKVRYLIQSSNVLEIFDCLKRWCKHKNQWKTWLKFLTILRLTKRVSISLLPIFLYFLQLLCVDKAGLTTLSEDKWKMFAPAKPIENAAMCYDDDALWDDDGSVITLLQDEPPR